MMTFPHTIEDALDALTLDVGTRAQLEDAARHAGPGSWSRISHLRIGRVPLRDVWRQIAHSHRRMPRGHEIMRQMSRGRPVEMVEERDEYPRTRLDYLRLFVALKHGAF